VKKKVRKILNIINGFLKKLNLDHIGEYTAQCAYFSFLSFIPFIILLLSLIKYMNIEKDTLAYILEAILPKVMKNSVLDIIQEVYSKSIETVSISLVFMLWSAAKSFYSLSLGLLAVYKGKEEENYILLRVKGVVGTVIALFFVVIVLILLVFGNNIERLINNNFEKAAEITSVILSLRGIWLVILLFVVFLFMYRFVPSRKGLKIKNQIPGALFASIGWYAVSYFFSIYVDIFTNFSVIYGSLATITLILMWLYTVIYIILLGAEFNVIYEKWKESKKIDNRKIMI